MKSKNSEDILRYHREKMANLMATTRIYEGTSFHVLDEAATHLMEHYNQGESHHARTDHCLIIGQSYFGTERDNENMHVKSLVCYMDGDLHELSHTIAAAMHDDRAFAKSIFHAMEVFALYDTK